MKPMNALSASCTLADMLAVQDFPTELGTGSLTNSGSMFLKSKSPFCGEEEKCKYMCCIKVPVLPKSSTVALDSEYIRDDIIQRIYDIMYIIFHVFDLQYTPEGPFQTRADFQV